MDLFALMSAATSVGHGLIRSGLSRSSVDISMLDSLSTASGHLLGVASLQVRESGTRLSVSVKSQREIGLLLHTSVASSMADKSINSTDLSLLDRMSDFLRHFDDASVTVV